MIQQLRLVKDAPTHAIDTPSDPIGRLFAHWLFMFNKSPRMCKLGPGRRRLLGAWLTVYDEGVLSLMLDGAAADVFIAERGDKFTSLEWLMRDEAQIERFAEAGERLHLQFERARSEAQREPQGARERATDEESQAAREAMRQLAARRSGRAL